MKVEMMKLWFSSGIHTSPVWFILIHPIAVIGVCHSFFFLNWTTWLIECLVNMQVMSNEIYKALDDRAVVNALYKTLTSLSVWKCFLGRYPISIVQLSCYSWEYVECWTSILCLILLILWSIIVKFVFGFNQFV